MARGTTHRHEDQHHSWNFIAKKLQCTPAQCKARWEEILSIQDTLNTDHPDHADSPPADHVESGHQAPDPPLPEDLFRAADSHPTEGPRPDPVHDVSSEAAPVHQSHADLHPELTISPTPPSTSAPASDFQVVPSETNFTG